MRRESSTFAVTVLALALPTAVLAQSARIDSSLSVPRLINITGVFRPADGQPPASVETVTLAIYAEQEGGVPLWQEAQSVTIDERGRYALLLGAAHADGIPSAVFASGAKWLGTLFDRTGEVEAPRIRITSVPYALRAADADTLGGRPASEYLLAGTSDVRTTASRSNQQSSAEAPGAVFPGSTNLLSKYVNAGDLGPSSIYEAQGQVGIGTTSPIDALHLQFTNPTGTMTGLAVQNMGNTPTSYSGMLFYDQNGALGQFQGFNNSTHEYRINNIARDQANQFDGSINFMIGGSPKLQVDKNGNVGIGYLPTSPFSSWCRLCVQSSGTNSVYVYNPGPGTIGINSGSGSATGGVGVYGWAVSGRGVEGESNEGGIGVWARADSGIGLAALSSTGTAVSAFSGSGAVIATFTGPGSVGIGTPTPYDKLHVAGDIRVGTDTTGCIKDADATVIAGTCSSDARLTKNITPFASALGSLTQLQPVYFDWRAEEFPERHLGNTRSFGLIAQDVEAVLPELVTTDAEGYKAVKYGELPFYMLQAIKDLKVENELLKQQLKLQEAQLSERLHRLEQLIAR
jgi:endosialidase-like protein